MTVKLSNIHPRSEQELSAVLFCFSEWRSIELR